MEESIQQAKSAVTKRSQNEKKRRSGMIVLIDEEM